MDKYGPMRGRFLPTNVEPFFNFQNSVGGHIYICLYLYIYIYIYIYIYKIYLYVNYMNCHVSHLHMHTVFGQEMLRNPHATSQVFFYRCCTGDGSGSLGLCGQMRPIRSLGIPSGKLR